MMAPTWIAREQEPHATKRIAVKKTEWAEEMVGILTLLSGFEHQVFRPPVVWYRGSEPGGSW